MFLGENPSKKIKRGEERRKEGKKEKEKRKKERNKMDFDEQQQMIMEEEGGNLQNQIGALVLNLNELMTNVEDFQPDSQTAFNARLFVVLLFILFFLFLSLSLWVRACWARSKIAPASVSQNPFPIVL